VNRSPAERARSAFGQLFGGKATLLARAPGRVNLIGEFTDYNEGWCLPAAIDRETVVAARARRDGVVHVVAADDKNREDRFSLDAPLVPLVAPGKSHWGNYVRGVFAALRSAGHVLGGAEMVIAGNVPQGAGLSSSAALEVAVGQALKSMFRLEVDGTGLALAGQRAEHEFAGCQCGIMDQLVSAHGRAGHAVLLDCRTLATTPVPIPEGTAIVVVESGIRRGLVDSQYNLRRLQCEQAAAHFGVRTLRDLSSERLNAERATLEAKAAQRARHVVGENERTLAAAQALREGDLARMGALMRAAHASLRDDFEVSLPPIDGLVDLLNSAIGTAGGARLTGGGFGGCVVALLPVSMTADIRGAVMRGYRTPEGTAPVIHVCSASDGAGVLA
jgi:galactokinase